MVPLHLPNLVELLKAQLMFPKLPSTPCVKKQGYHQSQAFCRLPAERTAAGKRSSECTRRSRTPKPIIHLGTLRTQMRCKQAIFQ